MLRKISTTDLVLLTSFRIQVGKYLLDMNFHLGVLILQILKFMCEDRLLNVKTVKQTHGGAGAYLCFKCIPYILDNHLDCQSKTEYSAPNYL